MRSLQLVLLGLVCVLGDPDVFANYFDDELRFVDVSQEVVLKACLSNGEDTVKKIKKAYNKCFGPDYSFDDLAETVGRDSDNDDLPDEYEGNEACFYKTMDWVKGKEVQPSVIEADMAGLPDFDNFKNNINSCSAWSGNFGGRKKRAVGEAPEDNEEVPSIMESDSGALQWVRSLVRTARNAEPGNGNGKENEATQGKRNKKGKGNKGKGNKSTRGKGVQQSNKSKKGKGKKSAGGKQRNKNKKGNGKKSAGGKGVQKGNKNKTGMGRKKEKMDKDKKKDKKNKNGKGRKNEKMDKDKKKDKKGKGRKNEKKGKKENKKSNKKEGGKKESRSEKSSDLLPDFVYNQLWCFDLAMEQALEKCVEDKLNN